MKTLSDYIVVVENVLSNEDCDFIVAEIEKSEKWTKAKTVSPESNHRACEILLLSKESSLSSCDKLLFLAAEKSLVAYRESHPLVEIEKDTGYDALRYGEGCFYKSHVDHSPSIHRALSCSFALNEDYEGGEWSFFDGEYKTKVSKGSAILFPSNFCFPHGIEPVTSGTRLSVVTWFV